MPRSSKFYRFIQLKIPLSVRPHEPPQSSIYRLVPLQLDSHSSTTARIFIRLAVHTLFCLDDGRGSRRCGNFFIAEQHGLHVTSQADNFRYEHHEWSTYHRDRVAHTYQNDLNCCFSLFCCYQRLQGRGCTPESCLRWQLFSNCCGAHEIDRSGRPCNIWHFQSCLLLTSH